ncbi:MAG: DNA-binding response regulator [Wenzhouxiangella sp.]|nr:MAG: DNA-binding response regulator [Wenzhouxiangella sp.]
MLIAIVEDDIDQGEALAFWLAQGGHQSEVFDDGDSALAALAQRHFDLIVVDWMLPDMQGDALIAKIRERLGWDTPVLVATVRGREEDIVAGLTAGADDYLVKPVKQMEFIARIEALARRLRPRQQPVLQAGIYELDAEQQRARVNGASVDLTQKELDLAWYLFSNPGKLFSRNHLLDKIWGVDADIDTRTVDTHASRLRRKLRLGDANGWKLESIYGYGYRMERLD